MKDISHSCSAHWLRFCFCFKISSVSRTLEKQCQRIYENILYREFSNASDYVCNDTCRGESKVESCINKQKNSHMESVSLHSSFLSHHQTFGVCECRTRPVLESLNHQHHFTFAVSLWWFSLWSCWTFPSSHSFHSSCRLYFQQGIAQNFIQD